MSKRYYRIDLQPETDDWCASIGQLTQPQVKRFLSQALIEDLEFTLSYKNSEVSIEFKRADLRIWHLLLRVFLEAEDEYTAEFYHPGVFDSQLADTAERLAESTASLQTMIDEIRDSG